MKSIDAPMNQSYRGSRQEVISFLPTDIHTLLDVGCSAGEFGLSVRRRGVKVWGVEPVQEAAEEAKKVLDEVVNGLFDDEASIPDDFFDVVTFNDSLEHFPHPLPPLILAKKKLKIDGTLICSIPNVRYIENIKNLLFGKDWEYTEKGILDETHLRFFTKKSMVRTIEQAGYHVTGVHGINPFYESGRKTKVLATMLGPWAEDMKYYEYVVIAKPA